VLELSSPVQFLKGVGPQRAEGLRKVGVETVEDLLHHLPLRYEDRSRYVPIAELRPGMRVAVAGKVVVAGVRRARRMPLFEGLLDDGTGRVKAIWFNQGTSSDGNTVVPFRTALFAAAKPLEGRPMGSNVSVQTLALSYTKLYGLPLGRRGRPQVAWYGDMDMASHAWKLLGLGPLDANIRIGPPVPLDDFPDRKALARYAEEKVRNDVIELLRGRPSQRIA
jgi:hypothetical protein